MFCYHIIPSYLFKLGYTSADIFYFDKIFGLKMEHCFLETPNKYIAVVEGISIYFILKYEHRALGLSSYNNCVFIDIYNAVDKIKQCDNFDLDVDAIVRNYNMFIKYDRNLCNLLAAVWSPHNITAENVGKYYENKMCILNFANVDEIYKNNIITDTDPQILGAREDFGLKHYLYLKTAGYNCYYLKVHIHAAIEIYEATGDKLSVILSMLTPEDFEKGIKYGLIKKISSRYLQAVPRKLIDRYLTNVEIEIIQPCIDDQVRILHIRASRCGSRMFYCVKWPPDLKIEFRGRLQYA